MSRKKIEATAPVVATTGGELVSEPQFRFVPYPNNREVTPSSVEDLVESIREHGLLQPVIARYLPPDDSRRADGRAAGLEPDYEIVVGERRVVACGVLGVEVQARILSLTDKDAAAIHAIENFQRKDLDPVEEAKALRNLRDNGWKVDEIAKIVGREKSSIYQFLRVLELEDPAIEAVRERKLSVHTAAKIAGLEPDEQAQAVQMVLKPKFRTEALSEREALEEIDKVFIAPKRTAKEWESKREDAEKKFPGAKWLPYEEAIDAARWSGGYADADDPPAWHELNHDAVEGKSVPTWRELAEKHGAPRVIGFRHGEALELVPTKGIIDAELAACDEDPQSCIFLHPKAHAAAQREHEAERLLAQKESEDIRLEVMKAIDMVLTPGAFLKPAKRVVEAVALDLAEQGMFDELGEFVALDPELEEFAAVEAALRKHVEDSRFLNSFEALGRLLVAHELIRESRPWKYLFHRNAVKPAEFPVLAKKHDEWKRRQDEHKAEVEAFGEENE